MDELRRRQYLEAMGIQVWSLRGGSVPVPEAWRESSATPAVDGRVEPAQEKGERPLSWEELQVRVRGCHACVLHETRTQTVFGVGHREADLMVIGEAPGADEDRQGEPFVGRAGKLLDAMLFAIGLGRDRVFIANVLKCRPPGNRDPSPEEVVRCRPFLLRQMELLQPRVILAVGRISAQNLLGSTEAVGRLRGRVHRFGVQRIPVVVTYHPAYLLRSPEQKSKAWQDLRLLMTVLKGSAPAGTG